jgi:hypothetical protein
MEIHAPHQPITSFKEAVVHLGIVTIGILIALGLETLVEWKHHNDLAREAGENIVSELRDNKRELDGFLKGVPSTVKDQRTILRVIDDVLAKRKMNVHELRLSFHKAELRNASWSTAQAAGALSFMPYWEIKKYAGVYEAQNEFMRLGDRTIDAGIAAMNGFEAGGDPVTIPPDELRTERDKILSSLSALTAQSQVGEQLSRRYAEALR